MLTAEGGAEFNIAEGQMPTIEDYLAAAKAKYGDDFAAVGGVPVWLATRAGWLSDVEGERAALRAGRLKIDYLPYDWALNDAP